MTAMIGEPGTAQQEHVGCGGMGMERDGTSPTFLFLLSRPVTLAGLDPGSPRGGPRGREARRRRPTHPPPQEAERCTWRPVLQLSLETGPAGRERRQRRRRRRGPARDRSGRRSAPEGRAAAAPGPPPSSLAPPGSHPAAAPAAAPGEGRATRPTCCALARPPPPPPRRPEPPPRTPGTGSPAPHAAERLQVSGSAPSGLPSLRRAPAAGWAPPQVPSLSAPAPPARPGAACHPRGAGQRRPPCWQHFRKRNWSRENKGAAPGALARRPGCCRRWGRGWASRVQARLSPAPLSRWR